jgi:hypothetical protein
LEHGEVTGVRRPFLLVDIDGVLNPWGPDEPEGLHGAQPVPEGDEPLRLAAIHGESPRELSAPFDLAWATAWGSSVNTLLGPTLGLPELPAVAMPPAPFPPEDKIPAIAEFVGARPVAWVDDAVDDAAQRWAKDARSPDPSHSGRP